MASFFSSVRQGFGGRSNKGNSGNNKGTGQPSPTSYQNSSSSSLGNPSVPPMPHSPALSAAMLNDPQSQDQSGASGSRKPPYFFREEYSGLIVKGNFMTLAAKPIHVEEGEWLAHQVVEQYRLLDLMLQIIKVVDDRTGLPICNPETCPSMSASGHTYTWLDANKRPIKIPAPQYINLVQKWIYGKINDLRLFPIDVSNLLPNGYESSAAASAGTPGAENPSPAGPTSLNAPFSQLAGKETWLGRSSGFPETFESELKSLYRQMFRMYAHIYHAHWLDPFWHIGAYKELNTCFVHFVNVGKLFDLLGEKECEPMGPLIELWAAKGLLPAPKAEQAQVGTAQ